MEEKISYHIYFWIPIAPNMMSEIKSKLAEKKGTNEKRDVTDELDPKNSNLYTISCPIGSFKIIKSKENVNDYKSFTLSIKIDSDGFSEFIFKCSYDNIEEILCDYLSSMKNIVSDILISKCSLNIDSNKNEIIESILPLAVKNKLAVLDEKISDIDEFYSLGFNEDIKPNAKTFIEKNCSIGIYDNIENRPIDTSGFPTLKKSNDEDIVLGYVEDKTKDGNKNDVIYCSKKVDEATILKINNLLKYFTFKNALDRTLQILKDVRDHIVIVRRQFIKNLKNLYLEDFPKDLIERKEYLAYINIKLPVILKIVKHFKTLTIQDNLINYKLINSNNKKIYDIIAEYHDYNNKIIQSKISNLILEGYNNLMDIFGENKTHNFKTYKHFI